MSKQKAPNTTTSESLILVLMLLIVGGSTVGMITAVAVGYVIAGQLGAFGGVAIGLAVISYLVSKILH